MEEREYLIGDVVAMIGVNRDTLRFYEEKGVISIRKKENEYRYYSEDDIFVLSSIFYHQKMSIGLEEIESLREDDNSFEASVEITRQQIGVEKGETLGHRQVLVRLHLFQEGCREIEQNLSRISLRGFPKAYIIETCDSPQDSVIAWFYKSQEEPRFDMLYTYDTYRIPGKTGSDTPEFQRSSLLLYEELTGTLPFSFGLERYERAKTPECLYTIIESQSRVPDIEMIQNITAWEEEHQVKAGNIVISDYVIHGVQDGTFVFYLEIYIPILR